MSNCLHQSQPVETSMQQEEVPPLEIINKDTQNFQNEKFAENLLTKLAQRMKNAQQKQFQNSLQILNKFFVKGYAYLFIEHTQIQKKMMNYFSKLARQLQKNSQAQNKMLFVLSLIAEMIKQSPKFYFPFTRKFLLNVFEIDNQSLQQTPYKNQILAILAVIYNNLSMQGRLIKKLNVEKEFKNVLLTNYYLINQLFTLKLFNRSILNLNSKGVVFTSGQFVKHSIMETITKFIAQNQVEMFLSRMKTCLFQGKPKHQDQKKLVL